MRKRRPEDPFEDNSAPNASEERRHENADLLREVLASLSPLDREILYARELEGIDDKEIARRFDMTVTGVRVRMHRARRRIQARYLGRRA